MKQNLFLITVLAELIFIFFLGIKMYSKLSVLGETVSVNPMSKDTLDFSSNSDLKNFYEPKPNTEVSRKRDWLPYIPVSTINSDGLNERFEYNIEKSQDTFRIITLGDSFTYGELVDTKDNYPEQLEDYLNNNTNCKNVKKFEVINLGVGGYDIEFSVERFRIRGKKYNPDLVLWFLKEDDFTQIKEVIKPKADRYKKQIEENGELKKYEKVGNFYPWTHQAEREFENEWGYERILSYQKDVIQHLDLYYEGPLVIFTFPFLKEEYQTILKEFAQSRNNTYFYKGIPDIYQLGEFLPDRHPNIRGHTLIAENLFSYLTRSNIVPCD